MIILSKRLPVFEMLLDYDSYIDKSAGELGCWPWIGTTDKDGYGRYRKFYYDGREVTGCSRISHILHIGPILEDLRVLHSCDNPPCVNPRHLSAGTHVENMKQMKERGRSLRGARGTGAKLTEEQAIAIYIHPWNDNLCNRENYTLIAGKFNTTAGTVYHIRERKTWKHIHELQTGS